MRPLISIIIPTYNRADILQKTLLALDKQDFPPHLYEILVIDDGSTDQTKNFVQKLIKKFNSNLTYFYQKNKGPATARNKGIQYSKGKFILFLGDDTIPSTNLISEHYKILINNPACAVLGYISWSKDIELSNFMKYLSPNGPQFNFKAIENPQNCGYIFFYTANISLERKWFQNDLFDPIFKYAALEDMDLSYRLEKKGLRIIFNPKAIVQHCHHQDIQNFLKRQKFVVEGIKLFLSKHPSEKEKFIPKFYSIKQNSFYLCQKFLRLVNLTNIRLFYNSLVQYNHLRLLRKALWPVK